jgi:hypothetical protein
MSKEPKSEQMIKSMVASLASQAVGIFLQTQKERREVEQELDWARMDIEDLQDKVFFLEDALQRSEK